MPNELLEPKETLIRDSEYAIYGPQFPADMKALYYGLGLPVPEDLNLKMPEDFEKWKSYGLRIHQFMDAIQEKQEKHNENAELIAEYRDLRAWVIGDFLVAGVKGGLKPRIVKDHVFKILGRGKLQTAKLKWKTLENYMVTCKAIPTSRRREVSSFSHHVEVQKFSPEEQDRFLDMAVEEQRKEYPRPFGVRMFRQKISLKESEEKYQRWESMTEEERNRFGWPLWRRAKSMQRLPQRRRSA